MEMMTAGLVGHDVSSTLSLAAVLPVSSVTEDVNKEQKSGTNAGCIVNIYMGWVNAVACFVLYGALSMPAR